MCCTGQEIDLKDIRTQEQKALMNLLFQNILQPRLQGVQQGMMQATPYPGALSARPDVGQIAAMNTMMGMGGYGGYKAPHYRRKPYPVPEWGVFERAEGPGPPGPGYWENWWERDPYTRRDRNGR